MDIWIFCRWRLWSANAERIERGQGLNHALADAANLVKAIVSFAENDLESDVADRPTQLAAINAYETEMIARGGEEVRLSWQNTTLLHNWEKALESPLFKAGIKMKK
jgi:2-polyprenyl-6-methoxyphenol hydroxylase-like FAD-dependent oxidoreductase